jgi:hypothetical protein
MGLPALLIPASWVPPTLGPAIELAASERLAELRALLVDVRRDRPEEGTPAEITALVRASILGLSSIQLFGPAFVIGLRANVNAALTDLVRKEASTAQPERKLALRHIEQAVHRYGVLVEALSAALGELPPTSLLMLLNEASEQVKSGEIEIGDDERVIPRFQLSLFVALDVLDAPTEELTFWAFRAINDARRVEALPPPAIPLGLSRRGSRGELARLRTRRAWLEWDAAEVAKELAPWPGPTR